MMLSLMSTSSCLSFTFMFLLAALWFEAPAATLHHYAQVAREEAEPGLSERCRKNATRDAHSFIRRWGLSWNVPISHLKISAEGQENSYAYIKPSDFLKFLINKAPELLMGGCPCMKHGQSHLESFWKAYQHVHPTHRLFHEEHEHRLLATTFALSIHGDEGRGLKKGNTTILMMETCLGVNTWENELQGNNSMACPTCQLDEPTRKKIKFSTAAGLPSAARFQTTNLREHSFLTKFVLAALPRKDKDVVDAIILEIVRDFNYLFDTGITAHEQQWFAACTGAKGDLKWFQRVGPLERCFGSQISINKQMCHECLAGDIRWPFEDASHEPKWGPTCYEKRPYSARPLLCHIPFEHQVGNDEAPHERFFRRDIFHNTKVGILRLFIASCVILLSKLHYFDERGQSNARDVLMDRAYHRFKMFCMTTGRTAALRSFSLTFFNSPTWNTFPWVNCKGSDTSHLLAWVHTMVVGFQHDKLSENHSEILNRMALAADAARSFQRLCYSHNLWLSKTCGGELYEKLHAFLQQYNACAFLSLHQWQYTGFGLTAKFHLIAHTKFDILCLLKSDAELIPSPQLWGCEMNEDVVGKISRLVRRVSARRASWRALQLYLIKSKAVYRRFQEKQRKLKTKARPKRV